jgi:hypothetical protein
VTRKKIEFSKLASASRIAEPIRDPTVFSLEPALIVIFSASIDENTLELSDLVDPTLESTLKPKDPKDFPRSRRDIFAAMREHIDMSNTEQASRLLRC